MDWLKDLNPQTIAVIGAVWLLREVFGWAKSFVQDIKEIKKSSPDANGIEFIQCLEAWKKVNEAMEMQNKRMDAQIELMRLLGLEIREVKVLVNQKKH